MGWRFKRQDDWEEDGCMNSVEIGPTANYVTISLFDVYTTTYFLTAASTLEEHREAGEPDEL